MWKHGLDVGLSSPISKICAGHQQGPTCLIQPILDENAVNFLAGTTLKEYRLNAMQMWTAVHFYVLNSAKWRPHFMAYIIIQSTDNRCATSSWACCRWIAIDFCQTVCNLQDKVVDEQAAITATRPKCWTFNDFHVRQDTLKKKIS